jgi:hypothetical protein
LFRGNWTGITWVWLQGGAFLQGQVDIFGHMSGDKIAYIYPDLKHILVGSFVKGQLSVATFCFIVGVRFNKGNLPDLTFTPAQGIN